MSAATTDVHSIGEGRQGQGNIIPKGLPEPFAKRTVERDLGIRWNAFTILDRVGPEVFVSLFLKVFPEFNVPPKNLLIYIKKITDETYQIPFCPIERALICSNSLPTETEPSGNWRLIYTHHSMGTYF